MLKWNESMRFWYEIEQYVNTDYWVPEVDDVGFPMKWQEYEDALAYKMKNPHLRGNKGRILMVTKVEVA